MHRPNILITGLTLLFLFAVATPPTMAQEHNSVKQEQRLLNVLQSDAPFAEKALACKGLAVHGTSMSLGELAKLLRDPKLSSWARIAIEAIPGEQSNQVLRDAAGELEGRVLLGVINSIGVRRDSQAVPLLAKRLAGSNADVARAAAISLGRIGNAESTKVLTTALADCAGEIRSAVAEGCILCAEQFLRNQEKEEAVGIYDQVRSSNVPQQRVIESTRGAILARKEKGIDLLLETFRSSDKKLVQLALGTIREFPGTELDSALATELTKSEPSKAALLIQAMADRRETVVLTSIVDSAKQGDKVVRLSAINALKRIGDVSCLTVLLGAASESDSEISTAALKTLAQIPDPAIDQKIRSMIQDPSRLSRANLIRLVGLRRIDVVNLVSPALDDKDANIRKSALFALGETIDLDELEILTSQLTNTSRETSEALRALRVACIRLPEPAKCIAKLEPVMNNAPAFKSQILEIIGEVGGEAALKSLAEAAKSDDPVKQDVASRLLGKWNNANAAPVLLNLAQMAPAEKYRIRALRGLIGIARKFPMPPKKRIALCKSAWEISGRIAEKKLILDVLKIHPSKLAFDLVDRAKQIPELKEQATATSQVIERKVKR